MAQLAAKAFQVAQAILSVRLAWTWQDANGDGHRFSRLREHAIRHEPRTAKNGALPRRFALSAALAAALLFTACSQPLPPENTKPVTAIVGARLIDGSDSVPVEDSVILIEGTRIRAAGPRSHTPVPKGGEIIDGTGKTVIPGLVDVHVHYFGDRAQMERGLRAQLSYGVTTVRSIGGDTDEQLAAIADLRAGKIAGPRLYTAGRGLTHPDGHPMARRPANPEEARDQVRELAAQKVDFIKVWVDSVYGTLPKITPEVRAAIVEEAGKRHIPVVAHIRDEEDVYQLGELGVTDFVHTVRDQHPLDAKFIEFVKTHGITFAPTLTVNLRDWYFAENPEALKDPDIRFAMNPEALANLEDEDSRRRMLEDPDRQQAHDELEGALRFVRQMAAAGVPLLVGSDSGYSAVASGWATHHEMALMVEAGLSPLEVIRIATRRNAERIAEAPEYGVIEAGKIADLVVLDADPLEDIRNTRKIARVMQAGQWLDRAALRGPGQP